MVSYIIPYVEGRDRQFSMNLDSLKLQTDQDFEIICVYQDPTITNPSQAFNWGCLHAKGNILCLTSPEVLNAVTNVHFMKHVPRGTYWVGRVVECKIVGLPQMWDRSSLSINGDKEKLSAHCTAEDWRPWKYFLGVLHREDFIKIGGMDDDYMEGIAWEDRDFSLRAEKHLKCEFNPYIVGIHLWHSRTYQDSNPTLRMKNRRIYEAKLQSENQRKVQGK